MTVLFLFCRRDFEKYYFCSCKAKDLNCETLYTIGFSLNFMFLVSKLKFNANNIFETMKNSNEKSLNAELETGEFGPIYRQFEKKPKQAIKHLRKMKAGECPKALYRDDIGYIDIVWGEVTDPVKHKGRVFI